MAKQKENPNQLNLLDLLEHQEAVLRSTNEPGSLNMRAATRQALCDSIKQCPLNRYEIAAKMSELLDQEVTKGMLDTWTSEAKEGHRFPLEYATAFCKVTGCTLAFEVNTRPVGLFCVESPDAIRAQLSRLEENRKKIQGQENEMKKLLSLFEKPCV